MCASKIGWHLTKSKIEMLIFHDFIALSHHKYHSFNSFQSACHSTKWNAIVLSILILSPFGAFAMPLMSRHHFQNDERHPNPNGKCATEFGMRCAVCVWRKHFAAKWLDTLEWLIKMYKVPVTFLDTRESAITGKNTIFSVFGCRKNGTLLHKRDTIVSDRYMARFSIGLMEFLFFFFVRTHISYKPFDSIGLIAKSWFLCDTFASFLSTLFSKCFFQWEENKNKQTNSW